MGAYADDDNGSASGSAYVFAISGTETNNAPTLTLTEPDGTDDTADQSYTITWTDEDPEEDATISLYYDTDNTGADGTLIVENISEDNETDSYTWDTTELAAGNYYLYGLINDGVNAAVTAYSSGTITIEHPTATTHFTPITA